MMLNILIADDSRFFRTIERQFLQKTPAHVIESGDSDDLFLQLKTEKPQLLFLAHALRPLNGAECCRRIKGDSLLRDLPVVMVCDQDMPEQVAEAERAGCNAVLVKPLDRFRFLDAARLFLSEIREYRYPCFMPVHFETGGISCRGKSLDISSGGVFIESTADIPIGSVVALTFTLPEGNVAISCQGVVVWHNRRPNPLKPHYSEGFGIKFREPPRQLAEELCRFARR
jgi:CheY-like chemotaxis protein